MHPKSQTVKEGSRVEFRCTVKKQKAGNLVYYWYKDGVAELGKNDCTLVLDPVELRHFGYYHCFVKYQDSFNEGVTSHRATLDIIPQSRKGMSECFEVYVARLVCVLFQKKETSGSIITSYAGRESAAIMRVDRFRI